MKLGRILVSIFFLTGILLAIGLSGCKSKESEKNIQSSNETESEAAKEQVVNSEQVVKNAFEKLDTEFEAGTLSESDYHSSRVQLVLSSLNHDEGEHKDVSFSETTQPIDISLDVQWMAEHFAELEDQDKEWIKQLSATPDTLGAAITETTFFASNKSANDSERISINPFRGWVAQAEEPTGPLIQLWDDNVTYMSSVAFLEEQLSEQLHEAYLTAVLSYDQFLGVSLSDEVVIHVEYYAMGVESYSFRFNDVTHIHINGIIPSDLLEGSMYHELFHAYQFQLGYHPLFPEQHFTMEASAIWAVTYVDEALGYHNRYDDAIYLNPILDPSVMSEEEIKSWYQLLYFMYQDWNAQDTVKRLVLEMPKRTTLHEALLTVLEKDSRLHNLMAYFGTYLFAERATSDVEFSVNSPLADLTFEASLYETMDARDMADLPQEDGWIERNMDQTGFYLVRVNTANPESGLVIMSDLGNELSKGESGMVVMGESDGRWKTLLDGRYDSLHTAIDFKEDAIDALILIFFNYSDSKQQSHKHTWEYNERIVGEGNVDITIEKKQLATLGDTSETTKTERHHYMVVENIELFDTEGSEDETDYMKLIIGDAYYVKEMQIQYDGSILKTSTEEDDTQFREDILLSGRYAYQDGDLPMDFSNEMLQFPDMSSLLGGNSSSDSSGSSVGGVSLGDLAGQAQAALEGFEALGGSEINVTLPGVDELEAIGNPSEEMSAAADLLADAMPKIGQLIRVKEMESAGLFELYPTFPSNLPSKEWVHRRSTLTLTKADGDVTRSVSEADIVMQEGIFPVWFHNPFFDPKVSQEKLSQIDGNPADFAAEYDTTEKITDQIRIMNGLYNINNLYETLNAGNFEYNIQDIYPSRIGTLTQRLDLEGQVFEGLIQADYIENNVQYTVSITLHYSFSE